MVYASSAATYGDGSLGYDDRHSLVASLQPLNPYGVSKNEFDKWYCSSLPPPAGTDLNFFNVSVLMSIIKGGWHVVFHAFNQIKANGKVRLFRSHRPDYQDGKQLRISSM